VPASRTILSRTSSLSPSVPSQTGPAGEEAGGEGYVPVTDNESGFWQTVDGATTSLESAVQEEACLLSDTRVSDGPEEAGSATGARETAVRDEAGREAGVRKEAAREPNSAWKAGERRTAWRRPSGGGQPQSPMPLWRMRRVKCDVRIEAG
jgi:hypothetical protein